VGRRLGQQQNVAVVGFTIASLGALGKILEQSCFKMSSLSE
jgi:hypothetical protein